MNNKIKVQLHSDQKIYIKRDIAKQMDLLPGDVFEVDINKDTDQIILTKVKNK